MSGRLELRIPAVVSHSAGSSGHAASIADSLPVGLRQLETGQIAECCLLAESADAALTGIFNGLFSAAAWPALRRVIVRLRGEALTIPAERLLELIEVCRRKDIEVRVDVVLPVDSDGVAVLAGRPNALQPVLALSLRLHDAGVASTWLVPLAPALVFRLEGLFSLAGRHAIPAALMPAQGLGGRESGAAGLDSDQAMFVRDFIASRLLDADRNFLEPGQEPFYRRQLEELYGWPRQCVAPGSAPAGTPEVALGVSIGRDSAAPWRAAPGAVPYRGFFPRQPISRAIARAMDVVRVLHDAAHAHVLRCTVRRPGEPLGPDQRFGRAVLIGAYGGEHIGDAAILGGVLFRLHRRHGTGQVVLMSQRPAHTRRLVSMIEAPVEVTVEPYERAEIVKALRMCDCLVFAGGPLIDLPKQLVRHLYAASTARRLGKPFLAEGVGPGPFASRLSRFTARRMIELASRISLRAFDCVENAVVRGLPFEAGRCPAFDYLETRSASLSRLPSRDADDIERLLQDTRGRRLIGINTRPIGHRYTSGAPGRDVAGYTREIEAQFEEQMAQGLRDFSAACEKPPCYIFFPMNAIQFGMSDLRSAFRLQALLGHEVDFRVWQSDASLDGVLHLLRHLDLAIAMRYHAAIFALSQDLRVIGVDYRIGKKDKVAELFDDAGIADRCARIDLLKGEWLRDRLVQAF